MGLHLPAGFIAESLGAQNGDAVGVEMFGLHQPAECIPSVGGHCPTRVNLGNEIAQWVKLTEGLGVEIVTGGRFDAGAALLASERQWISVVTRPAPS